FVDHIFEHFIKIRDASHLVFEEYDTRGQPRSPCICQKIIDDRQPVLDFLHVSLTPERAEFKTSILRQGGKVYRRVLHKSRIELTDRRIVFLKHTNEVTHVVCCRRRDTNRKGEQIRTTGFSRIIYEDILEQRIQRQEVSHRDRCLME